MMQITAMLAPGALSPMRLKWKATFIEEVVPKEAAVLRRAQSEPLLGASGRDEFSLEGASGAYVDLLEAEVDRLLALPMHAPKKQRPSKGKSPWADVDVLSIASLETVEPGAADVVFTSESTVALGGPGGIDAFGSESWQAFSRETTPASTTAFVAFAARFGGEAPKAPGRVGVLPFCSEPPALPSVTRAACSAGSVGHPQLCNRPCIQFSRGECASGAACKFCHLSHGARGGRTPHLDKRHREQLLRLPFAQRAAIALPIVVRQVAKLGIQADAEGLLRAMEAAASPPWDARTRREGASLISALGALSFYSLLTVVGKAPDTPEWLRKGPLEEHMERIRAAERMQSRQGW